MEAGFRCANTLSVNSTGEIPEFIFPTANIRVPSVTNKRNSNYFVSVQQNSFSMQQISFLSARNPLFWSLFPDRLCIPLGGMRWAAMKASGGGDATSGGGVNPRFPAPYRHYILTSGGGGIVPKSGAADIYMSLPLGVRMSLRRIASIRGLTPPPDAMAPRHGASRRHDGLCIAEQAHGQAFTDRTKARQ